MIFLYEVDVNIARGTATRIDVPLPIAIRPAFWRCSSLDGELMTLKRIQNSRLSAALFLRTFSDGFQRLFVGLLILFRRDI